MADSDLDALLHQLKLELEEWEAGDRDPDELRRLVDAVEDRLDPDTEDDDSVLDDVNEAVVGFESSHPRLAGLLRQIADTLGGVGL